MVAILMVPLATTLAFTQSGNIIDAPKEYRPFFDATLLPKSLLDARRRKRSFVPVYDREKQSSSSSKSSAASKSSVLMPMINDLTPIEREELSRQLKRGACAIQASDTFKAVCERELKKLPRKQPRTGTKNPYQP
jgi:hypothetical protein